MEGALDASPARDHEILLNVRALADPTELQEIVEREFARLPAKLVWMDVQCFPSGRAGAVFAVSIRAHAFSNHVLSPLRFLHPFA